MRSTPNDVCVLVPIHGQAPFLEKSLESIGAEIAFSLERGLLVETLLVLDRPSRDAEAVARKFQSETPGVRILESNMPGIAGALNTGLSEVQARYIARFDCDDIILPGRLESQVRAFVADESLVLVGGQFIRWSNGRTRSTSNLPTDNASIVKALKMGVHAVSHSSIMIPTSVLRNNGGYADKPLAEDWDLYLRLTSQGSLRNLEHPVTVYRFHKRSETGSQLVGVHRQIRRVVLDHQAPTAADGPFQWVKAQVRSGTSLVRAYFRGVSQVAYRRSLAASSTAGSFLWLATAGLLDPSTSIIRVQGILRTSGRRETPGSFDVQDRVLAVGQAPGDST